MANFRSYQDRDQDQSRTRWALGAAGAIGLGVFLAAPNIRRYIGNQVIRGAQRLGKFVERRVYSGTLRNVRAGEVPIQQASRLAIEESRLGVAFRSFNRLVGIDLPKQSMRAIGMRHLVSKGWSEEEARLLFNASGTSQDILSSLTTDKVLSSPFYRKNVISKLTQARAHNQQQLLVDVEEARIKASNFVHVVPGQAFLEANKLFAAHLKEIATGNKTGGILGAFGIKRLRLGELTSKGVLPEIEGILRHPTIRNNFYSSPSAGEEVFIKVLQHRMKGLTKADIMAAKAAYSLALAEEHAVKATTKSIDTLAIRSIIENLPTDIVSTGESAFNLGPLMNMAEAGFNILSNNFIVPVAPGLGGLMPFKFMPWLRGGAKDFAGTLGAGSLQREIYEAAPQKLRSKLFNNKGELLRDVYYVGNRIFGTEEVGEGGNRVVGSVPFPDEINKWNIKDARFGLMQEFSRIRSNPNLYYSQKGNLRKWVGYNTLGQIMDVMGLDRQGEPSKFGKAWSAIGKWLWPNADKYASNPVNSLNRVMQGSNSIDDIENILGTVRKYTSIPKGIKPSQIFSPEIIKHSNLHPGFIGLINEGFSDESLATALREIDAAVGGEILHNVRFFDRASAGIFSGLHTKINARRFVQNDIGLLSQGILKNPSPSIINLSGLLGESDPVAGFDKIREVFYDEIFSHIADNPDAPYIFDVMRENINSIPKLSKSAKNDLMASIWGLFNEKYLSNKFLDQGARAEEIANIIRSPGSNVGDILKDVLNRWHGGATPWINGEGIEGVGTRLYAVPAGSNYVGATLEAIKDRSINPIVSYIYGETVPGMGRAVNPGPGYHMAYRLNKMLAEYGLGLPDSDLQNTASIYKNLALKRVLPAFGAVEAWKYANYVSSNTIGFTPDKAIGNIRAHAALAGSWTADILGITNRSKALVDLMPGVEDYWQPRSYEEQQEYLSEGREPVRRGRWWLTGCLLPDVEVMVEGNPVRADKVAIGDTVKNIYGIDTTITHVFTRSVDEPVYSITTYAGDGASFIVTGNHPVPVAVQRTRPNYSRYISWEWVRADELKEGQYLAYPRPVGTGQLKNITISNTDTLELTTDLFPIFGWYLANGIIIYDQGEPSGISFTLSKEHADTISSLLKEITEYQVDISDLGTVLKVTLYNSTLAKSIKTLLREDNEKRIPDELLNAPSDCILFMLMSYLLESGADFSGEGIINGSTTNRQLQLFIQKICLQLGIQCSIEKPLQYDDKVKNKSTVYPYCINLRDTSITVFTDDYVYFQIKSIDTTKYSGTVYDFEVAEGESFCLIAQAVHNSRQAFVGDKIQYYSPSWYQLSQSKWQEASNVDLNSDEYWGHSAIPTPSHPFSPIKKLLDPYWWEEKHKEDRPYIETGTLFSPDTFLGNIGNMTIGRILKPTRIMHPEYLEEGVEEGSDSGRYGAPSATRVSFTKSGEYKVLQGGGALQTGLGTGGEGPYSSAGGGQSGGSGTWTPIKGGDLVDSSFDYSNAISSKSFKVQSTKLTEQFWDLAGIYGYAQKVAATALGTAPTINTPVIQSADRGYGYERRFWDRNLGGIPGDLSEFWRRIIPHRNRNIHEYNPVPNKMPDWMPGEDYFINFKTGDPYVKIPAGEIRLPGEAYERIHGVSGYGSLTRVEILSDVAPWSNELKTELANVRAEIAEDTPEVAEYKQKRVNEAVKRASQQKKIYKIRDYRFNQKTESREYTIKSILDANTFIVEEDEHPIRLAGTRVSKDRIRKYLKEQNIRVKKGDDSITAFYRTFGIEPGAKIRAVMATKDDDQISDDMLQTKRAAVFAGGTNVNRALIDTGVGIEKTGDNSAPGIVARYGKLSRLYGLLWEKFAHLDTPFHTKLLRVRSALEEYKRSQVYGTTAGDWAAPIKTYVRPTMDAIASRNPILATLTGAFIGSLFGRLVGGKKIGAAVGGALAAQMSIRRVLGEVFTGEKYIPKRVRKRREIEEYYDALRYVKYTRLSKQYADAALEKEGIDILKVADEKDLEGDRIKKELDKLENRKRAIMLSDASVDWKRKKVKRINREINKIVESNRKEYDIGPLAARALLYRGLAKRTITGAIPGDPLNNVMGGLPRYERELAMDIVANGSPREKKEFFSLLTKRQKSVLGQYLGIRKKDTPQKESLKEFFKNYQLPDDTWAGWKEEFNLENARVVTAQKEGVTPMEMGIYPINSMDAKIATREVPIPVIHGEVADVHRTLETLLKGRGVRDISIELNMSNSTKGSESNIEVNLSHDRTNEVASKI
jgi:hypothetical protein